MAALWMLVALLAQDKPEPGPIPTGLVMLDDDLAIAPRKGDATAALKAFLDAHALHKKGDTNGALKGYLAFLGFAAKAELPQRYVTTARQRLDAMREQLRKRYASACETYKKNRKKGLDEFTYLSLRFPMLPVGRAAEALVHTDAIYTAIAAARTLDKAKQRDKAARLLEKAVRRYRAAIYRYEAKSLLVDLGGPDLFEPGERVGEEEEDEGETTIEESDDG